MKRIFAVVFVLIVLAAFTPLNCFAQDTLVTFPCDALKTDSQLASGNYKLTDSCDLEDYTIILNGDVTLDLNGNQLIAAGISDISSSSFIISGDGKVKLTETGISVSGDISITGNSTVTASGDDYGIYADGDITISGDDTQVTAKATSTSSGDVKPAGIYAAGKIDILGGTVKEASGAYYGIYSGGDITISGAQTQVTAEATGVYGSGIYAYGHITIDGSTVEKASGSTYGIYAYGDITIDGGTVEKVYGGTYGISAAGGINISGTVENVTSNVYGIHALIGGIKISGTVKEVSGGTYGIYSVRSITINGGTVKKASGIINCGIYAERDITITDNAVVQNTNKIAGGTIEIAGGANLTEGIGSISGSNSVDISGGTVTATSITTSDDNKSTITISGGTVTGGNQIGCDQSSGKCSVNISGNADVQNTDLISGAAVKIEGSANLTTGIGSIFGSTSVTISGGTVNVTGSNSVIYTTDNGAGIRGGIVSGGSITISGAQTQVTAQVLSTAHDDMIGIYAAGNIDIQSGTVTANGDIGIFTEGNNVITISGNSIVNATGDLDGILGNVDIRGGSVTATGTKDNGILSDEFTIYAGEVTAEGGNTGINCSKSLFGGDRDGITINGGEVEATGGEYGIQGETVTINEGTVTAKVTEYDPSRLQSGIFIGNIMTVNGGEVTAKGGYYGIDSNYQGGTLIIKEGVTSLTATGFSNAVYNMSSVKNAVSGIGWSNTAGTGNGTIIDPSESGRDLSRYRMVQFPLPGVKETPAPNNLTYNGSPQALVTAGTAVGGTMQYAPGTATEPTGGWSESIPTGTDARSYTVWYKVKGPGENNESGTSSVSVTIAPKSITGAEVTLDPAQLTYNGSEQSVNVTEVTIDGLTVTSDDYTVTGNKGTNADGYTAKITGKGNFTGTAEAKWSIGPKTIAGAEVTLDKTQLTYNGTELSVSVNGVTIDGLSLTADDFTVTGNTGTDKGEYKVIVTGTGNFADAAEAKWSIGPKTIAGAEVTLDKTQLTYNGSEQSVGVTGVTIDGLSLTADDFTVTGNTGTNAGGYTATVTGQGNFTGTAEAAWSIAPKAMTVSAENVTVPYDGQPHGITVTVTDPSAGAVVTYGKAEGTYDLDKSPAITNVSESPLTVYYQVTAANYTDYTGSAVVTITAADDLKSKPIQNELTSVPPELAEFYSDLSELQNALMAKLAVKGEPAQIGQTAFYDVILLISTDGINWVEATEENFPEGGLWVLLKYPEGTGKDTHDFSVSHMFTVTSERLGTTKGDIEYPDPEKTDEGLNVKLTGLSPVAIAWREINTPGPEPEPERPGIDFFRLHADCGLPATGFSALRPAVLPEQPKDLRYEPVRMHLMLPTLDRDVELVTMPREGNSWAAAWLGADAGILEGSALPGEGVTVIAGHNTLNDTDYGPFALLSTLEVNDTVMVREESGALKLFRVYANELLEPDDMERLSALAGDDALVLLTCENESPSGTYLHRRAVFAR